MWQKWREQSSKEGREKEGGERKLEFSDGLVSRQPLLLLCLPSNCSYAALFEVLILFKIKDEG